MRDSMTTHNHHPSTIVFTSAAILLVLQSMCLRQAQEQLLLRLRKHLQAQLPAATLTSAWQQLQQKVQGETCMGARLALTPSIPDILQTMSPAVQIVCLYVSQDASVLYCTALRGQQASAAPPAAKAKGSKPGNRIAGSIAPSIFRCWSLCFLISAFSDLHTLPFRLSHVVCRFCCRNDFLAEMLFLQKRLNFVLHFVACCNLLVGKSVRLVVSTEPCLTSP